MKPEKLLNNFVLSITIIVMSIMLTEVVLPLQAKSEYKILGAIISAAGFYTILHNF